MSNQTVYLNGEYLPLEEARVPVLDRGFIFGDGIYEVVPVYAGVPFRWRHHLARLKRSLAKVGIVNPHDDAGWDHILSEVMRRHDWPDQFVYIQVTRGVARRDHAFPAGVTPTVFAMASELVLPPESARAQGISIITAPDERWLHCDIKSISLLGNVLARQAAVEAGASECVMFRDGFLTEGSASNLWVVRDARLLGAPRDHLILEGIRYGLMEELAQECGIPFELRRIAREEVFAADELLLSSATKEVMPVTTIDGGPVGSGKPGPVWSKIYAAYRRATGRDAPVAG